MLTQAQYIFYQALDWIVSQGLTLILLTLLALLVPRIGRLINRYVQSKWEDSEEDRKASLALVGAAVYIGQGIAYFLLILVFFKTLGLSLMGAAVPATVISAALGFGAQALIGDFLAGFFIITEKQYGVGDWVQFEGNGVSVEGDVMQITMRATKIRTLNGENVTIPNGTARVCINYSNYWARAVAVLPVPLLGSDSVESAISRSTTAAERALEDPVVKRDIMGELEVHPAVDITPPSIVGMPWMMTMRFIVQVNPARQWAVERAIRTEVLKEFWDEYGSATTVDGMRVAELRDATSRALERQHSLAARSALDDATSPDTPHNGEKASAGGGSAASGGAGLAGAGAAAGAAALDSEAPTSHMPARSHSPQPTGGGEQAAAMADERTRSFPVTDVPVTEEGGVDKHEGDEHEDSTHIFRKDTYEQRWKQVLSLGGRIRVSTMLMMVAVMVLLIIKLFTVQPADDWRANTRFVEPTTSTTQPSTSETTSSSQPSTSETSEPAVTSTEPTTENTAPTNQPNPTSTTPTTSTTPQNPGRDTENYPGRDSGQDPGRDSGQNPGDNESTNTEASEPTDTVDVE
ncbi:putative MscS family protein YkuT [Corynebacterium ciconiae DSM 44920]|uniref:mechanosensitive ion channel family protein n=1 Tax=Corynebacterium ciconiae TaxID=227319 RepID=UPI000380DE1D|nr:mechanosensitive ion channel family protein [Corynebacterium ciconiae]WKD61038.1 putative MscS family protein YkuT [Corynebacterium ciconiae DSM 44920]